MVEKNVYYIAKYKKGSGGNLIREVEMNNVNISTLQKIFNINPDDPDIIVRNMVDCYDIDEKKMKKLSLYTNVLFDFKKYDYTTGSRLSNEGNQYYVIREFEKPTPTIFIQEKLLAINSELLRKLFKDEKYAMDPDDAGYEQLISFNDEYIEAIKPYVDFEFDTENFDYWIEGRTPGEERDPSKNIFY